MTEPECETCGGSRKVSTCCGQLVQLAIDGWRCSKCGRYCKNAVDFNVCPDCQPKPEAGELKSFIEECKKNNTKWISVKWLWDALATITRLQAELIEVRTDKKRQAKNLEAEIERLSKKANDVIYENAQLQAENERLKEFARHVIKQECWEYYELDGGEIQDLAEKLGLIVLCKATEDDVGDDSNFELGDPIYKFSETLKGE